jgi:hypothetical protein
VARRGLLSNNHLRRKERKLSTNNLIHLARALTTHRSWDDGRGDDETTTQCGGIKKTILATTRNGQFLITIYARVASRRGGEQGGGETERLLDKEREREREREQRGRGARRGRTKKREEKRKRGRREGRGKKGRLWESRKSKYEKSAKFEARGCCAPYFIFLSARAPGLSKRDWDWEWIH